MIKERISESIFQLKKGTGIRYVSVFLCVLLVFQNLGITVGAAGIPVTDASAPGVSSDTISAEADSAAKVQSDGDAMEVQTGGNTLTVQSDGVATEMQTDGADAAIIREDGNALSQGHHGGESGEDDTEPEQMPEIRYDFCEIDHSEYADEEAEPEVLESSYLSLEDLEGATLSVSGNLYQPLLEAPQSLSPVRNQTPTDTCWAFATTGVMELNAIREGFRDNTQSYSPYHMAYFMYHHIPDPLGGTDNDSNTAVSSKEPAFLNAGGNLFMALFHAANWAGPVDEELAPFDTYKESGEALADALGYAGEEVLQNGYMLSTGENMVQDIKQAVVAYGGVAVMYNGAAAYRNSLTGASYCGSAGTNHAVVIVGWDDAYSTDNFLESHRPGQSGAWIVKNSWGTDGGMNGYYFISYEDQSIAFPTAIEMMPRDAYDNNYHYDGSLAATQASVVTVNSGGSISNIFTAHASEKKFDERLEAVSIACQSTDVRYELSVYRNLQADDAGTITPDSGTLALSQTGEIGMAGIYTIPLQVPVVLENGESFSVVFRLYKEDGSDVAVWTEKDYDYTWCKGSADIQKGQSYRKLAANYKWFDLYNTSETNKFRNLARIKAFTNTLDSIGSYDISRYTCSVSENTYVADGTPKCPEVTLTKGDEGLAPDRDYTVMYENNVESGTACIILTGCAPYYGTVRIPYRIYAYQKEECPGHVYEDQLCINCGFKLRQQELVLESTSDTAVENGLKADEYVIKKTFPDAPFALHVTGNMGALTYQSENEELLLVDQNGVVTIRNAGEAHLTIRAETTAEYAPKEILVTVLVAKAMIGRAELSKTCYEYDRVAKTPSVTVWDEKGGLLSQYRDYAVSYSGNNKIGTAYVQIVGIGNYQGELTKEFYIVRRAQDTCSHVYENGSCIYCGYTRRIQTVKGTSSYEKKYSEGGFRLDAYSTGDGALSYASDDEAVATVDSAGYVTIHGTGSCYVTVSAAQSDLYYPASMRVLVEVIQGTALMHVPAATITKAYGDKAFSLGVTTNSDGALMYQSGNRKIAVVSSKGKVTIKGCGKVTLTVTSAETEKYAQKTKKITLKVVPQKAVLSKVKAKGNGKAAITIKKNAIASGYQIQYATDRNFTKNKKTKTLTKASNTKCSLSGLKKGKTYYFRVRSYKTVSKIKYYGAYSSVKKVKVK